MKILQRDDTEHGVDYVKLSDVKLATIDAQSPQCDWKEDDEGYWETSCQRFMCFEYGPPNEHGYKFCHHCGLTINFIKFTWDDIAPSKPLSEHLESME